MKNYYKEKKEEDLAKAIAKVIGYTLFALLIGAVLLVVWKITYPL